MTYCLFSCLTHFLNTFTPFFIPFVCSISEFELFQGMLHTNVWLKSPFYVRFVHLICKNQQEKPNAAGHPERPLDFPSKRSLNLHAPLRRLFAVNMPLSGFEPSTQWSKIKHITSTLLRIRCLKESRKHKNYVKPPELYTASLVIEQILPNWLLYTQSQWTCARDVFISRDISPITSLFMRGRLVAKYSGNI